MISLAYSHNKPRTPKSDVTRSLHELEKVQVRSKGGKIM